jgi:ABC-type transport system involved in Fe-S cluster assembly fused permease/ATPase subunit
LGLLSRHSEDRKTPSILKENYIAFKFIKVPTQFQTKLFDFKFKKRKIIIRSLLKWKEINLFDSGTSAYELLTSKEVWEKLKLPNSVNIEKGQSG